MKRRSGWNLVLVVFAFSILLGSRPLWAYSGGSGNEAAPYQISTATDWLQLMNTPSDWKLHFILTADINLSGVTLKPIAPDTNSSISSFQGTAFTGIFNGNGFIIRNAMINQPTTDFIGIFGCVGFGAEINNLGIENANIIGKKFVGGLVGYNFGLISSCYTTGTVRGTDIYSHIGGLVGENYSSILLCHSDASVIGNINTAGLVGFNYGIIKSCHATGFVAGNYDHAGGLVGKNDYGALISWCYATGTVTGTQHIGGLLGKNDNSGLISNCYATGIASCSGEYTGGLVGENDDSGLIIYSFAIGPVTGRSYVGGLVGLNNSNAKINSSYSTGSVTGTSSHIGGLVGYNVSSASVISSYSVGSVSGISNFGGLIGSTLGTTTFSFWDTQTSGMSTSAGGTGKITSEMQTQSTFTNPPAKWDFVGETVNGTENIWHMPYQSAGYPMLYWQRDITGDITGSYGINLSDFNAIAESWLSQSGDPEYNPACNLDNTGGSENCIDAADLAIFFQSWLMGTH